MTTEQIVLAEIRKNIGELGNEQRIRVGAIAQIIRDIAEGEDGMYALALVGAELAAEDQ